MHIRISFNFRILLIVTLISAYTFTSASPIINQRFDQGFDSMDVKSTKPPFISSLCGEDPPDTDLIGLGVRLGIYFQIVALVLGVCCGV